MMSVKIRHGSITSKGAAGVERLEMTRDFRLEYHNTIVEGFFDCSGHFGISTLKGSPIKVTRYFDCSNTGITSLEGCPRDIGSSLHCEGCYILSLHDIHKHVDRIGQAICLPHHVKSHVLGILKIRGLRGGVITQLGSAKLYSAVKIINKYLTDSTNPMKRDIHRAQEEMIDAGLVEFAQI